MYMIPEPYSGLGTSDNRPCVHMPSVTQLSLLAGEPTVGQE